MFLFEKKNTKTKNNPNDIEYNFIFLATLLIDLCLIYILIHNKLNTFDTYNIYSLFLVHILFYISLINKYDVLIEILHIYFVINTFILSLLTQNSSLILLYILILLTMFACWYVYNKCPMGKFKSLTLIHNLYQNNIYKIVSPYIPIITCILLIYKLKTL
jgi:hypothetical protein